MFANSSIFTPSAVTAGCSAIRGELVLEIEKLALQLAIGAFDLRARD